MLSFKPNTAYQILLLLYAANTQAAINKTEFSKCANNTSSLDRLACYDELAQKSGFVSTVKETKRTEGDWRIFTQINPLDDTKTITLSLIASNGSNILGNPISFYVRCKSGKTEVYINWNDYLGSEAIVTTRVGSKSAETSNWSLSTDKKASFAQNSMSLLRDITSSNQFVAQITPYNESPVTAVFNTTGLKTALSPILETCNWKIDVPPTEPFVVSGAQMKDFKKAMQEIKLRLGESSREYQQMLQTYNSIKVAQK